MTDRDQVDREALDERLLTLPRGIFAIALLFGTAWLTDGQLPEQSVESGVEISQFWINCSAIYAVLFERKAIKRFFAQILLWYRNYVWQRRSGAGPAAAVETVPVAPQHQRRYAGSTSTKAKGRDGQVRWVIAALFAIGTVALVASRELGRVAAIPDDEGVRVEVVVAEAGDGPGNATGSDVDEQEELPAEVRRIARLPEEYCWDLAVRCVGNGYRWRELGPLNSGLYRDENTCDVEDSDLELNAPADWDCS